MAGRKKIDFASMHAKKYDIEARIKGESREEFECRVACELRKKGLSFEAHEAFHDEPFDRNFEQTA